jgi:hypothetical protein
MYEYPYHPPPPRAKPKRWRGLLYFLGAAGLVVVAVTTYVLLNRLSDAVLTVIATIGCAAGVALPGLMFGLVVLLRRAESNGQRNAQPQVMPPVILPPTVLQPQQLSQYQPPPPAATWEQAPGPRRFVVVGEESED